MTTIPQPTFRADTYKAIVRKHPHVLSSLERKKLKIILLSHYRKCGDNLSSPGKSFHDKIQIVEIILSEIGLGKAAVLGILLREAIENGSVSVHEIELTFNIPVESITKGMSRIDELYEKKMALETENFRKLLLTLAEDIRVILIIIAERLQIMRVLGSYPEDELKQQIARESSFLYAPLAHRMGLYAIKTELEDLSLKYTNREIYTDIAKKLNETKRSRDKYIAEFIDPLKDKLKDINYDFTIKGRTKSIHSIYSKIKKQNTPFEKIYDLFAIRIILDTPQDKEKAACWQAYSIITDMYQPNPNRLRDWLSIPKSNGYESLHTTVLGPQGKWVEVQIRTVRMDEIAEKGLAAHWKYKGIKSESGMDEWLKNIREILENPELNAIDFMDEFKLNLYDKEVFVFTPNGDLYKLPKGATVLDFAFSIHTGLGTKCMGGRIGDQYVPLKHILKNGDQVEILTSPTQKPNQSWLNIVTTSRAKTKIRQALKEYEYKDAEMGKETLLRRFKNWKIETDDGRISKLAKKLNYKTVSDFYQDIAREKLDIFSVRDAYIDLDKKDNAGDQHETRSAESFVQEQQAIPETIGKEDVLIIGEDLKNVEFKLSKCCNPIYGDDVFGFVSISGGIKIHRTDCPNAPELIQRFGYRIVKAQWSGKSVGNQYPITLRIVGHDDIGIVTNITSLISKEKDMVLRSISIDSNAGLFQGNLTIMVGDIKALEVIIKKIRLVKGVKNVSRA